MRTVRHLHDRAMSLADEMIAARHRGDRERAKRVAVVAYRNEEAALLRAIEAKASDLTRIVLLRSATALLEATRR